MRARFAPFKEGDVQHWWASTLSGAAFVSRFSDDLLWLHFVTAFYVGSPATSRCDEVVPFLEQELLKPDEQEVYKQPSVSEESATYLNIVHARSIAVGSGVPGVTLMGSGDWNDGMNRVGHKVKARASGRLGSFTQFRHLHAVGATARRRNSSPRYLSTRSTSKRRWKKRVGTVTGIAGSVTTAPRRFRSDR